MSKRLDNDPTYDVTEAFRADVSENDRPVEVCPFLDILPLEECQTPEQRSLWNRVQEYTSEASDAFHRELEGLLDAYTYGGGEGMRPEIREFLMQHGLTFPEYKFRFGEEGRKMLDELGIGEDVCALHGAEGVLIFQLPKPLAEYWWKSSARLDSSSLHERDNYRKPEDYGGMVIEWGKIYSNVMPAVWEVVDRYNSEGDIRFDRINDVGQHDPKEYYYVWVVE